MSWRTGARCPMAGTQKKTCVPLSPPAASCAVSLNSRPVSAASHPQIPPRNQFLCSAETVGRFRFRKPTQGVIKGDFHGIVGAKTVRTSGHHTKFVVEALDGTVGDLAFGPKPVQQQLLMGA